MVICKFYREYAGTRAIVEALIEKGILTPPDNGIGAEGCWMSIAK